MRKIQQLEDNIFDIIYSLHSFGILRRLTIEVDKTVIQELKKPENHVSYTIPEHVNLFDEDYLEIFLENAQVIIIFKAFK